MNLLFLTQTELTVIRGWLHGLSMDTLQDYCGDHKASEVLTQCRAQLILKARRLHLDWGEDWLERKRQSGWQSLTFKRLEQLQHCDDVVPEINQPLSWWLEDELVHKLKPLSLLTVNDWLRFYQSGNADNWWITVPGLGVSGAKAIEQQIAKVFPDCMVKIPQATLPICYETAIVPLTQFLLPEELNGSQGDNRSATKPLIPANDDYQAISCWLSRLEPESHTHRSYQREAERLLLWTVLVKHKALSSLNMVDMSEYRQFLSDPQPQELWIGVPQKKKHLQWKPFTGCLSSRSRKYSETVINGLFNFLVTQHYCLHNPLQALPKLKIANGHQPIATDRSFSETQWQLINDFINRQIEDNSNERLKWLRTRLILQLGYSTGLRLHELAQATLGDISIRERQLKNQYWLQVLGKGHKIREVPLPSSLYCLLTETYQQLTGRSLSRPSPEYPLIPKLRGSESKALTPLAIHKILKQAFTLAAKELAEEYPETAEKLRLASTHWLRHTHGSMAVDKNIPLTLIRDNLGHSNIATTSHYVHADKDARHEAFVAGFSKKTT